MMKNGFAANRLRHVARRIGEVPFAFLVSKLRLMAAPYWHWPGYAVAARRPRSDAPHFSAAFLSMGEELRAGVRACARTDAAYRADLEGRTHSLLADRALPCLGYGRVPVPEGSAWHTDSTSGFTWSNRYFARVNFLTHGQDADVKVPWEVSRLQWLVWLGEAAAAHPDPEQARHAGDTLRDTLAEWRRANPVGYGPNWTVSMEVAIRAINVALAVSLAWEALGDDDRRSVRVMLHEHAVYLHRFPELSDHVGNHYLVNVCGLIHLSVLVFGTETPGSATVKSWVHALVSQFEADGLHVEHAPLYHRLCVETVLWAAASLARVSGTVPTALAATVEASCTALRALEMSSGLLPVIGDADSGQVVLTGEASRSARYIRQLLGVDGGIAPLMRLVAGGATPLQAAADALRAPSPTGDSSGVRVARLGPYVRMSRGPVEVAVRAGAHGLHGRASHDHDDNAAPWVTLEGRDLLVEGGCFTYTRSAAERLMDLSSARHNVATIGDHFRFVPLAGSMSPTVANAPIAVVQSVSLPEGRLELALTWVDADAGTVSHRRRIEIPPGEPGVLRVEDDLTLSLSAQVVVRWHFAPAWCLSEPTAEGCIATADQSTTVSALLSGALGAAPPDVRIGTYRFSGRYGEAVHAPFVEATCAAARVVRLVSEFRLVPAAG